jgi:tRNA pseudouridine55 synthase
MEEIEKSLAILKKRKTQIPPMTSAVKINGKKLYEYQRKNIEIEVPEREVTLKNYEILSDLRYVDNHFEIDLKIEVSKGYFVRSLARDLGELLGGKAIIKELRRTKSGIYSIENAKALDEVKESDIIPVSKFFDFKKIKVLDYLIPLVKNGITLDERQTSTKGVFYVDSSKGILAIYEEVEPLKYKPIYFFEEDE